MHPEARDGLARQLAASGLAPGEPWRVLDLGGRDINGSIRDLLPNAQWTGCDITDGPGVDLVHDATQPWPAGFDRFDVVVCTEVLEHVEQWQALLGTAAEALDPNGPELLFITCASTGRPQHGASGAPLPEPGEWYANVPEDAVTTRLRELFWGGRIEYRELPGDVYAWAQGVKR